MQCQTRKQLVLRDATFLYVILVTSPVKIAVCHTMYKMSQIERHTLYPKKYVIPRAYFSFPVMYIKQ